MLGFLEETDGAAQTPEKHCDSSRERPEPTTVSAGLWEGHAGLHPRETTEVNFKNLVTDMEARVAEEPGPCADRSGRE